MSNALLWALCWYGSALAVMSLVVRRKRITHFGYLFLLMMIGFHIGGEILNRITEGRYRSLLTRQMADNFLWVSSPAVFVFAVSYCFALRWRQVDAIPDEPSPTDRAFVSWRVAALFAVPLYYIATLGRGFVPGSNRQGSYLESGLTGEFVLLAVAVFAASVAIRSGHVLPVLMAQAIALALLGQRLAIVAGSVLILYAIDRHGGRSFSDASKRFAVLFVLVVTAMVSSARVDSGRQEFAAGATPVDRATALVGGLTGFASGSAYSGLLDDYVYRVDGNAFGALVLAAQENGGDPVGFATIQNSVGLAIPSALNPGKLQLDVTSRNEEAYVVSKYKLLRTDYLPTHLGVWLAWGGPFWIMFIAGLFGVAVALLDRFLRQVTPVRTIVGMGFLIVVIYYERGPQSLFVLGRTAVVAGVLAYLAYRVAGTNRRERPAATTGEQGRHLVSPRERGVSIGDR